MYLQTRASALWRTLASLHAALTIFALVAVSSPLTVIAQETTPPAEEQVQDSDQDEQEQEKEEEEKDVEEEKESEDDSEESDSEDDSDDDSSDEDSSGEETLSEETEENGGIVGAVLGIFSSKKDDKKKDGDHKIEVCHVNPTKTQIIEIDENAWETSGHSGHEGDFIIQSEADEEWCESAKLKIVKVIEGNDDASPEAFSFKVREYEEDDDEMELKKTTNYTFGEDGVIYHKVKDDDDRFYTVTENPAENYETTYSEDCELASFKKEGDLKTCTITNTYTPPAPTTATIHATKIVCVDEMYLPNWGAGGDDITASTAEDFLAEVNEGHEVPVCSLAPDWKFQWVKASDDDSNPGDNLLTEILAPWTSFAPTGNDGTITTEVPPGERIWVREVLKSGFIPFTGQNTTEDVSAEMYCGGDVLNYDNWDYIDPVVAGETYYCVAFNAIEPEVEQCTPGEKWADAVVGSEQGKRKDNTAVLLSRSNPAEALGANDGVFYSLGFGGSIILSFEQYMEDGIGDDLFVYETTNGSYPLETASVEVSKDGVNWFMLTEQAVNTGGGMTGLDVSETGLDWFRYVQITDTTNPALHQNDADGFDLNAVKGKYGVCSEPPPPVPTKATISATKVMCDSEELLPNMAGGADITATTATDFVSAHSENCWLEEGYVFQWAPNGTSDPADNGTTPLEAPWTSFAPTDENGLATTEVTVADVAGVIQVREVLKSGDQTFTGDNNDVSAEMFCASDVAGYDNWEWITNPSAGQTYHCVAFNANPNAENPNDPPTVSLGDVTMCKASAGEVLSPLSGWTLMLQGDFIESLSVPSENPAGIDTLATLTSGTSYLALASGTWNNQGGANAVDAEYSTTDGWSTQMDGYIGYQTDILELQINEAFDADGNDWGPYSTSHQYAQSFIPSSDGSANFRIFDGSGTTQNAGWFGDNSGSLSVDLYEGYAGVTGEDGCVTLTNVPYGTYSAEELAQDGWTFDQLLDGDETLETLIVSVNEPEETFTFVNSEDGNGGGGGGGDAEGTLVVRKHTVGGDGIFNFYVEEYETIAPTVVLSPDVIVDTGGDGYGEESLVLPVGTYSIYEAVPEGWNLLGGSCGELNVGTVSNPVFTIEEDETTYCDFYNEAVGETSHTTIVSGNTSAGENLLGWMFNRDGSTETPFEFNTDAFSIGTGSLFVPPITNTVDGNSDKFIAELFMLAPMEEVEGITWDFKIGAPDDTVEEQFYMNVYANFPESSPTKFYDCRYNIVASVGSTGSFTTVTFDPTLTYPVTTRTGGDPSPYACPASPADMDIVSPSSDPSIIRVIALNLGDSTASDTGVSGYFDNVVVVTNDGSGIHTETYDFEPETVAPTTRQTVNGNDPSSNNSNNDDGEVAGVSDLTCGPLLYEYLGRGYLNPSEEVVKLQEFLNAEVEANLPLTGFFGPLTEAAVRTFQLKYWEDVLQPWFVFPEYGVVDSDDSTGIVYKTTKWKINNIFCADSEILPTLP